MSKILGIVGSPRDGNTKFLVSEALKACEKLGCETEMIHLGKMNISHCKACNKCKDAGACVVKDDFQEVGEKVENADGIIIGSPVYFGGVSSKIKAFMDRTRYLRRREGLKDKVGGGITAGGSRHGGQETCLQQIHQWFLIQGMIVVGDEKTMHYGGTGFGYGKGDMKKDEYGIETSRNLGRHVAELAKKLKEV